MIVVICCLRSIGAGDRLPPQMLDQHFNQHKSPVCIVGSVSSYWNTGSIKGVNQAFYDCSSQAPGKVERI